MENNSEQKKNFFYAISLGIELGLLIVVPSVLFLLLGIFLDRKFNTFPIFMISFIILGLVFIVVEARFLVLPFLEKRSQKK